MPYLSAVEMKRLVKPVSCHFGRLDVPTQREWNNMIPGQRADYVRKHAGYTYVFKGVNGHCKIGCTRNLRRRLFELRSNHPSHSKGHYILAFYSQNMWSLENFLHEFFETHHVVGEWFHFLPEETDWIENMHPPIKGLAYNGETEVMNAWDCWDKR